ncbi:uncharacterized protein RAG0_16181 [Rhynchosporium agropyri]|uniref:Uncharacterized protein n=1 Tax=Rhynchosporium agropyri TaxID=914238 RepID=A0A1E1LR40_9HELO|nr:uncharacterized protein RAG0_16181 [Rhynchosporium agropyri]
MTSIHERVQAASAQNTNLLKTISETEYSVAAHQQATQYINALRKDIADHEDKLKEMNRHVDKEYADHKKFRDSHMKRLAFKLGGKKEKFQADASREEKEWLDAVATQLKTKQGLEHLNVNLADATKMSSEFRGVIELHNHAKSELDALYKSLFDGPTPDILEEDEREEDVARAENNYHTVALRLSTEKHARNILTEAEKFLAKALGDISDAESHATMDMWGVGGTFAEMAEHSALSQCQQHVSQVEQLISQAQRVQPAVQKIGDMRIAQMNFMSNVVFDNIFSDMHMRERIQESGNQLKAARTALQRELGASDRRRDDVRKELNALQGVLDKKRVELQDCRKAAFERAACLPGYTDEPPRYS